MALRYASTDDLALFGLPTAILEDITTAQQEAVLDYASARIDEAIQPTQPLPLGTTPLTLKRDCCMIAAYEILRVRGFNPEGHDQSIIDEYNRTVKRLTEIGRSQQALIENRDAPPARIRTLATVPAAPFGRAADGSESSGF